MRQVAIVHFNTPELTEAAILSLRKHGGEEYHVTIFDNSDSRPFKKKMDNAEVIDNTRGQLIDFGAELAKFPNRDASQGCAAGCEFGSAKHMMSVQYIWDNILTDGFLLMDSDILLRQNVEHMFDPNECTVGHIQTWDVAGNPAQIDRLVPMLLWINVPLCNAGGARFFDPDRNFALHEGGMKNRNNWYDTGASFLEDIRTKKPACHGLCIDIRPLMHHYGSGSWRQNDIEAQMAWLDKHRDLWEPCPGYQLGSSQVPAKALNKNAKIFILTHRDFKCPVKNVIYNTTVDMRIGGDSCNGLRGSFYSELLGMKRVYEQKRLPSIVGFCGWRKYFGVMDVVPDLDRMLKARGCAVSAAIDLTMPMRTHYALVGNVKDLDMVSDIIAKCYPKFNDAWKVALANPRMHPFSMFIMRSKDFRRMFKMVWDIVDRYRQQAGDIDERIENDLAGYHIPGSTREYQYRIGGQMCERLVSAWIDWQFPQAEEVRANVIFE